MSNPSDPKPNPDQPDPKKPEEGKPGRTPTGGSSYEFQLPEGGSYSDLPPLPQPEVPDATSGHGALPPRPSTTRPSSGSFDFIDLGDIDLASLPSPSVQNLPPAPAPAASGSPHLSDDALPLPPVAPTPGDSSVAYALPAPTSDPSSFTLGSEVLDLANLPQLPELPAVELPPQQLPTVDPTSDILSVPDLSTLFPSSDPPSSFVLGKVVPPTPAAPVGTLDSAGSFVLPELPTLPAPDTSSNPEISGVFPASATPAGFGSSVISPSGLAPQINPDASGSFVLPPPQTGAGASGVQSTPDLSSLPAPESTGADQGSFVGTPALADLVLDVPTGEAGSNVFSSHPAPPGTPTPVLDSSVNLSGLQPASADSDVFAGNVPAPATPTPNLDSFVGLPSAPAPEPEPPASAGQHAAAPTPDLESVVDWGQEAPVVPRSGWLGYSTARREETEEALEATPVAEEVPLADEIPVAEEAAPEAPTAEVPSATVHGPTARSSFDFELPDGVKTYSDIPPPPRPDANEPSDPHIALPPRPVANRVDSQTFDLIDLAETEEAPGSGTGLPKPPAASSPAEPPVAAAAPSAPLLTPTEGVITVMPAYDPEAVVGNLEPVDPVAPASGWLDSDVLTLSSADPNALVPTAEPTAGTFDPVPADAVDSSDIFSGNRVAPAVPVEQSDVIAATAYGSATPADSGRPVEPVELPRPSEIALTFDGPPGGSTLPDGMSGELPVADEAPGSDVLVTPSTDEESIHDMPDPALADPLFDSAKLAEAPDLPAEPAPLAIHDDAPEYGVTPLPSADASSILADLNEAPGIPGGDSSSVRVEAPGVDRTLAGNPAEGAFDLTVSDEPIPADLFGESSDGSVTISTDWQSQSGSDLFAEGRTTPEIDIDADRHGKVEPVDADLVGDQPSLTSAPSSIFSGNQPPPATGSGSGSASVRIGHPEQPGEKTEPELVDVVPPGADEAVAELTEADFADVAEFSAHPAVSDSVEQRKASLPPSVHKASSGDFELPAEAPPAPAAPVEDDAGAIDWDAASILQDDDNATRGIPKDASLSAIMRELSDDSTEMPTRQTQPISEDDGTPMVTVDWMANSGESTAVTDAQAREAQEAKASPAKPKEQAKEREPEKEETKVKPKAAEKKPAALLDSDELEEAPTKVRPSRVKPTARKDDTGTREKEKPAKKGGGMLVGLILGGVLAGGAAAGVYFSGIVPNSEKQTAGTQKPPEGTNPGQNNPDGQGGQPQNPPVAGVVNDAGVALASGDVAKALELVKAKPAESAAEKAVAGSVRVFAKLQELGKTGAATAKADDADLALARKDLQDAANDPEAAKSPAAEKRALAAQVQLGVSYEVAGNAAEARRVFTDGKAKFPKHAAVFDALLERLDAAEKGPGTSLRTLSPADAERLLLATTILLAADAPPAKAEDDPEPGLYYWKAVNNAAAGKYPEAIKLIGEAKAAHVKRAKALAGRGLNPLTDPLEQMFARSCDELASYWKLREELYKNPAVAAAIKKDGIAKTLDSLTKAQTELTSAKADIAKLEKDVAKLGGDVKAAEKAKIEAEVKLKTADADLKTAQGELKTAQADLKTAKADVAKLTQDVKDTAAAGNKKVKEITDDRDRLAGELKKADALIAGVAAELKPAKVLPEKWTPADVVAGVKTVAGLAGGADAQRVVKAEAAAKAAQVAEKAAADKLAAETKASKEKYDTDTAKLKTDHAAEVKKLTDAYSADLKKLNDEHAAAVKKIKDDDAAAMKKAADKFALDTKNLTEDHLAAVKKLKDGSEAALKKLKDASEVALKKIKDDSEAAIKAEQAKVEAEKKTAALKEISFQKQLANAITPAQSLDIWLALLTDLRRASDADPAMATASKALSTVLPESEDAAKAHTVTGMGLLLKGNYAAARDEFQTARKNPAYPTAKDKAAWAKAADAGLEATDDPLALYRRPVVVPPVDVKAAAKSLDAGIAAYKAGKYEAAVTALADAAKNDPTDPVAWYYLGAARWAAGDTKQAEKDIGQGAEREKLSTVPGRVVSGALAPIQGAPRDLIDKARP